MKRKYAEFERAVKEQPDFVVLDLCMRIGLFLEDPEYARSLMDFKGYEKLKIGLMTCLDNIRNIENPEVREYVERAVAEGRAGLAQIGLSMQTGNNYRRNRILD